VADCEVADESIEQHQALWSKQMTVDELIEQYQTAVDEMNSIDENGEDADDFDDWSIQAANAAAELKGKTVVASVKWHNGRTTETTGVITSLDREKVYLETAFGLVEGDAMGMTAA
jgi:hypothetical protein